ncbi:MAG: hypothetical protein QQN63_08260, partial [Nitrosopumilus sp.]
DGLKIDVAIERDVDRSIDLPLLARLHTDVGDPEARRSSAGIRSSTAGADPQQWSFAWRTEANKGGFKSVDFLMREIVDTGKSFETGSHINQPKKEN